MMMIKRSMQFLAPLVLVVALGACGSDSKKSDSTTAATAAATTVDVATTAGSSAGTSATDDSTATGGSTVTGDSTAAATGDTLAAGSGEGSDFCSTNKDINDGLSGAEDADAGLVVLKQLASKFDGFAAAAPAELKDHADGLVAAAKKAIAANDANILITEPATQPAIVAIDTYCGYTG